MPTRDHSRRLLPRALTWSVVVLAGCALLVTRVAWQWAGGPHPAGPSEDLPLESTQLLEHPPVGAPAQAGPRPSQSGANRRALDPSAVSPRERTLEARPFVRAAGRVTSRSGTFGGEVQLEITELLASGRAGRTSTKRVVMARMQGELVGSFRHTRSGVDGYRLVARGTGRFPPSITPNPIVVRDSREDLQFTVDDSKSLYDLHVDFECDDGEPVEGAWFALCVDGFDRWIHTERWSEDREDTRGIPASASFLWFAGAVGCVPLRGDQADVWRVLRGSVARMDLRLRRGRGGLVVFHDWHQPIEPGPANEGLELRLDGRTVGSTDARGFFLVEATSEDAVLSVHPETWVGASSGSRNLDGGLLNLFPQEH